MRNLFGVLAALMVLGLILNYWAIILLVVGVVLAGMGLVAGISKLWEQYRDQADRRHARYSALAARAETEHQWYLEGDPRGIYGAYPPADPDATPTSRQLPPTMKQWREQRRQ